MTRWTLGLTVVWALEIAGGVALLVDGRLAPARPPAVDWTLVDPLAAEEIAAQHAACASAADWRRLGDSLMAYGYFREAEACQRTAAALAPESADDAFRWAFSLERLGLLDEADRQYEQAEQLERRRAAECRYFMARNRLRQEQPEAAQALFEQAGDLAAARCERARLLARGADPRAALPLVEALVAQYPWAVEPHYLRWRIERLTGDGTKHAYFADAAALAKRRLPNPFDVPYNRLMATLNDLGARRVVEDARRMQGPLAPLEARLLDVGRRFWQSGAADMLAEAHFERRDPAGAKRLLEEALDKDGPSAHFLIRVGDACEELGDAAAARGFWERSLALGSPADLKDLHDKLARLHDKTVNKQRAATHRGAAYFGVGVEAFWADDLAKAQGALRTALEHDPQHESAWFYLGETCRLLRQPAEARTAYERCLKLRPERGAGRAGWA